MEYMTYSITTALQPCISLKCVAMAEPLQSVAFINKHFSQWCSYGYHW